MTGREAILQGDNLEVLPTLPHASVTLCYLDPPFFTGRDFGAFDDRWPSLDAYVVSLRARLILIRPLLAAHGSCVVHVDPKTSHYVKVMGDEVFGRDAFASEIVWRYRRWPARTPNFQRVHDVLLRWVKDPQAVPRFVQQYEALAPSTLKTWGRGKQQAVFDENGRRRRSSTAEAASPGVPLGDVWDIPIVAPVAKERTGYPTQKPEALLERLILATTAPGDLVLDPYCGSGTTVASALRLGRRAIGIDIGDEAVRIATARTSQMRLSA